MAKKRAINYDLLRINYHPENNYTTTIKIT